MKSQEVRKKFLDFFESKQHKIVPSAPIVVKNDPSLMFINSGMAPFKDLFLGISPIKYPRVADTQKCLRVSGKHNDLEEVGVDTYHHTMFEMLGNWSFGDYFKKEAIEWAWELLTTVYKIDKDRLYVTVFEGDEKENLAFDQEAYDYWKKWISEDRILRGNKKDNFWEMGDMGPCGPCSEIHIDLRDDDERKKTAGKTLVNKDHPQVIEIWNNVFMEFNRKADGSLEPLPAKHVDTGMGFERLCMVLQNKKSTYDTDVFEPTIKYLENQNPHRVKYGEHPDCDIAIRVIVDHMRAITFTIADGQLPSNTGAGYVTRRILRRAVRYGSKKLGFKTPFLHTMVPLLAEQFKNVFPEVKSQQDFICKVIQEEENSFFRTLTIGENLFWNYTEGHLFKDAQVSSEYFTEYNKKIVAGKIAFELYDTHGFPIDLTQLMAREKGWTVDMEGFNKYLEEQKDRSRTAAQMDTEDWVELKKSDVTEFVGYDTLETEVEIVKYRKVKAKGKEYYQLVLNKTPFYAESGGQVGDTGKLIDKETKTSIKINDTQKESNLIIHFTDQLPTNLKSVFIAQVDRDKRVATTNNHSATHLLHAALKQVLGSHVNQKGSLVNADYLRFDFSHFSKVSPEELSKIETIVNQKIVENISLNEQRNVPYQQAIDSGVTALFGEKYGDFVRVITFDDHFSKELCGGTHVINTGQIGVFKIIAETAVAAGVRRIEAITSVKAMNYFNKQLELLAEVKNILNNPVDVKKSLNGLLEEQRTLKKQFDLLMAERSLEIKKELKNKAKSVNGIHIITEKIELPSADLVKQLAFELRQEIEDLFLVLGTEIEGKPYLAVMISDNLVKSRSLNAGTIVRELAKEIDGGGGGQPFFATAGGKKLNGLENALKKAFTFMEK